MDAKAFTVTVEKFAFALEAALEIAKAKSVGGGAVSGFATLNENERNALLVAIGYYADLVKREAESGTLLDRYPKQEAIKLDPARLALPNDGHTVIRTVDADHLVNGARDICIDLTYRCTGFSYTELFVEEYIIDPCGVVDVKAFGDASTLSDPNAISPLASINRLQALIKSQRGLETAHTLLVEAITKDIKGLDAVVKALGNDSETQTETHKETVDDGAVRKVKLEKLQPLQWLLGVLSSMEDIYLQKFYEDLAKMDFVDGGDRHSFVGLLVDGGTARNFIKTSVGFRKLLEGFIANPLNKSTKSPKDSSDEIAETLKLITDHLDPKRGDAFVEKGSQRLMEMTRKHVSDKVFIVIRNATAKRQNRAEDKALAAVLDLVITSLREFLMKNTFSPDVFLYLLETRSASRIDIIEGSMSGGGGSPPNVPKVGGTGHATITLPAFGKATPKNLAEYALQELKTPLVKDKGSGEYTYVKKSVVDALIARANTSFGELLETNVDDLTAEKIFSFAVPARLAVSLLGKDTPANTKSEEEAVDTLKEQIDKLQKDLVTALNTKKGAGESKAIFTTAEPQGVKLTLADKAEYDKAPLLAAVTVPMDAKATGGKAVKLDKTINRPSDGNEIAVDKALQPLLTNKFAAFVVASVIRSALAASSDYKKVKPVAGKFTLEATKVSYAFAKMDRAPLSAPSKASIASDKKTQQKNAQQKVAEDASPYDWGNDDSSSFDLSSILENGNTATTSAPFQW